MLDTKYFVSLRHPNQGDTRQKVLFIRKKKYPSGNIGVIVAEKVNGRMRELHTVGIATDKEELEPLIAQGQEWIDKEKARRHPRLDLFGEERQACRWQTSTQLITTYGTWRRHSAYQSPK